MNNKHTADTLKFFLGQKVYSPKLKLIRTLYGSCTYSDTITTDDEPYGAIVNYDISDDFYPILRLAEDLTREEIISIFKPAPHPVHVNFDIPVIFKEFRPWVIAFITDKAQKTYEFNIYFTDDLPYSGRLPIQVATMQILLKIGAGAIPSPASPTGYGDFIHGLPCYTPNMVEEMGL